MESFLLIGGILRGVYCLLLFLTALFLILLVLIQRGRGGGLAGAFGGMGGQSAFGTKAGDTFTKITIVVATCWIVLCILGVKYGVNVDSKMASGPALSGPPVGQEELPLDTSSVDMSDLDASTSTSSAVDGSQQTSATSADGGISGPDVPAEGDSAAPPQSPSP